MAVWCIHRDLVQLALVQRPSAQLLQRHAAERDLLHAPTLRRDRHRHPKLVARAEGGGGGGGASRGKPQIIVHYIIKDDDYIQRFQTFLKIVMIQKTIN